MSKREWEPGDVALVNGRVCIRSGYDRWDHGDPRAFAYHDEPSLDVRPLVVIDPENREDVERLADEMHHARVGHRLGNCYPGEVDQIQAALREFANPKPPKPEEPTGLGAVVEDDQGALWVRTPEGDFGPWTSANKSGRWGSFNAVRVVPAEELE